MTIFIEKEGFTTASLTTKNIAHIYATSAMELSVFYVSLASSADVHKKLISARSSNWAFDEAACCEASEFFLKLAGELERRTQNDN